MTKGIISILQKDDGSWVVISYGPDGTMLALRDVEHVRNVAVCVDLMLRSSVEGYGGQAK